LRQQFPNLLPGTEVEAEFVVLPAVSVKFKVNDIQIDASNGRLTLSAGIDNEERLTFLPQLAQAISDRLPHTPVIAVGFNFVFRTEPDRRLAVDRFLNENEQDRFYSGLGLTARVGRQVTHSFALPESTLNLTYEYRPDTTTMVFNFHHNVTGAPQVRDALGRFAELLAEARRLSNAIDPES
jgi:hypothetical protein